MTDIAVGLILGIGYYLVGDKNMAGGNKARKEKKEQKAHRTNTRVKSGPVPKIPKRDRSCLCPGYPGCFHKVGEPCTIERYGRRLKCSRCQKMKGIHKKNYPLDSGQKTDYEKITSFLPLKPLVDDFKQIPIEENEGNGGKSNEKEYDEITEENPVVPIGLSTIQTTPEFVKFDIDKTENDGDEEEKEEKTNSQMITLEGLIPHEDNQTQKPLTPVKLKEIPVGLIGLPSTSFLDE